MTQPQPPYGTPDQPQPFGYGWPGVPVPAWARVPADPMPDGPREYQQMVRGRRYAWWRPLLALLLCAGFALSAQVVLGIVLVIVVAAAGGSPMTVLTRMASGGAMDPLTFSYVVAGLISLIPSAMLASWIVNRIRPRFLSSVTGGLRWGWLLRCLAVCVPIFAAYLVLQFVLGWDYQPKPRQWVVLLVIVVIGIPFQSAGEEYAFRGLILQNVGSWFGRRTVGLVVAIIPSVLLFALAHGSFDPWVFADLAVFAVCSCILAWRTGGLEASIALHATNNVLLMITTILFGGWADAFVTQSTTGSPLEPLATLVVDGLSVAVILWWARRIRLQRLYAPAPEPAPAAAGLPG